MLERKKERKNKKIINNSEVLKIETEELIKTVENIKEEIEENTYHKILNCINDEVLKESGEINIKFSCRSRYCPICSNKLKLKELNKIRKKLEITEEKNYLLMTLDGNNVTEKSLREEINDNNRAYKLLIKMGLLKKIVVGYIKTVEISYIKEKENYLPHLHIILVVKNDYRKYLKLNEDKKKIKRQWNSYKKSNDLFADIQSVRNIDKVVTYLTTIRKKRYVEMDKNEVKGIIKAIKDKKRLYSYGGILSNKKRTSKSKKS